MNIETQSQETIYYEDIRLLDIKVIDAPTRCADQTMPGYYPVAIMKDNCKSKVSDSGRTIELTNWTYLEIEALACIVFIDNCEKKCFADISLYDRSKLFNTDKITTFVEYERAVLHRLVFDKNLAAIRKKNMEGRI